MTAYHNPNVSPQYWSPTYRSGNNRPGILTAIGVISIIVASLSILSGLIGGLWTMAMYQTARAVATQSRSAAAASSAATPAAILPSPDELESHAATKRFGRKTRRDGLLDLLQAVKPMSPAVRAQMDGLLARHAEQVLPSKLLTDAEVSTNDLRSAIESTGPLPPVQAGDAEGTFIVFKGTGRIEVYANRAVFIPADGSGRLRTNGPATTAEEDAAISAAEVAAAANAPATAADAAASQQNAPPAGNPATVYPSGLNGAQVQSILQSAQAAAGGKLTTAQQNAITSALQTQVPPLVQSQMVYSPIRLANVGADGGAMIAFSNGTLLLDSNGMVLQQFNNNLQEITIDPVGMTLMIGEAIVALLLAFFLLLSGILVLRNSSRGAAAHWVYALLKLPLAILGAVAFAWVMQDVMSGVARLGGGGLGSSSAKIALWIGIAGVIYPVALMIVLASPGVREYYRTKVA